MHIRKILPVFLPYIVIIVACFWAIRALLIPGFFTMHDDEQIARLFDLNNSLLAGQIPPRWVAHLGFGYGYPLFNFYPPFVYYAGEIFYLLGFSLINATKIVMALGFILSAIFMYLWVKNRYGILPGLLAAILYVYAPYHGVDLYVRGSLSEFFSFVWIPAVFWAFDKIATKKSWINALFAGVLLSFVILTHSLTAIAFIPFLSIYVCYLFYEQRKNIRVFFPLVYFAGVTALGLSCYFWLPSLVEKNYTLVDQILTKENAAYYLHFVCLNQFWNSPWGYGGSVPGCIDGLSFQVGKLHLVLAGISLFGMYMLFFYKKVSHRLITVSAVVLCLFIFALFMTTSYSQFIWNALHPLWYLQFPWRFLLFSAVFLSFLGGFFLFICEQYVGKRISYILFIILSIIPIVLMAPYFKPQKILSVTDAFYTTNNDIQWRVSNMSYEYVPKGVATKLSTKKTTMLAIAEKDISKKPYKILSGDIRVSVVQNKPQYKIFTIVSSTPGNLQINTFSFPGWYVVLDGRKITYTDHNKLKLITVPIPSGTHTLQVILGNTLIRTISNGITLLTLLGILALCFDTIFFRKRRK